MDEIRSILKDIIHETGSTVDERLQRVCEILREKMKNYDWVGFYFHREDKPELYLRAFAGEPTDHDVIPFGKGICGQVAMSNKNFVVPDVNAQDNYLACSIDVRSEIVIPLFVNGKNVGQIDIDSNTPDAFNSSDERLLEYVNNEVAKIL